MRKPTKNLAKSTKPKAARVLSPLRLGEKIFIRTVTNFLTGRVVLLKGDEIVLTDAAWIADTARWNECLKNGTFNEVEPYPDNFLVGVGRGAIVDYCNWPHDLPRSVK